MTPSAVIVLAAGEGTRMRSSNPKVLHSIAGRTLLGHVLHTALDLSPTHLAVVVGAGRDQVEAHLANIAPEAHAVFQERRGGTGHATRIALHTLEQLHGELAGTVIVVGGDTPLLTGLTLRKLLRESAGSAAAVLTAEMPDPYGYGRIVRDEDGSLIRIVEERDADEQVLEIDEVNSGIYAFEAQALREALATLSPSNAQGEEYLTDVIEAIREVGGRVSAVVADDFVEILGVNDRAQLAECGAVLRDRINDALMQYGVTMMDPTTTWIDVTVEVAGDVTILPGSALLGDTRVDTGAVIGPRTTLIDCAVGENAEIVESTCQGAFIGPRARIGPYSFLRLGTQVGPDAKVGAFVEMKNVTLGEGSKVPHLSYVGDAKIGVGSNIGAATIFVNYDGVAKHETVIGDHVRIGSDTMLIAPVTVGDGAYTAAGSVITDDVPAGAMGVGRAKQRNILGWVARKRAGSAAARAAEKSTGTVTT
ncbi:MAG TPA: bifunctional UDP-N-acetylglucosamine diphosphorylase/glucosamine-1-phosphate N-acetyltransferase GlmU [Candidatus Nanopelagicaceae bacterium]|nr:bifunctional UDP-N-acetylglucosamine diphosphorylase/glucosamine-1-phosphate N-acetyltransferase GlmU [Candidatus Nanopelagicaceae bacterium]